MARPTVGRIVATIGALVLGIGMWSSGWVFEAWHPAGFAHVLSLTTFVADIVLVVVALPLIVFESRHMCIAAIVLAAVALVAGTSYLVVPPDVVAVGPFAVTSTTGALLMLAGAMLLMPSPIGSTSERRAADGRRLIYGATGKLIRIEQWDGDKLVRSSPVGVDGLIADDGAPRTGE